MASKTAIKVIRVPSMPGRGRKGLAMARRGAGAVAKAAAQRKHTMLALIGAGLIGYAKKSGMDLPKIDALGVTGTYGAALLIIGELTKNRTIESMGTGLACVAVYQLAAGETVEGDEMAGDGDF